MESFVLVMLKQCRKPRTNFIISLLSKQKTIERKESIKDRRDILAFH